MTTTDIQKPWDFSQVLHLINTLDAKHPIPPRAPKVEFSFNGFNSLPNDSPLSPVQNPSSGRQGGVGLGNFSKVWEFLGAPQDTPVPRVANNTSKVEYTSPTLQQRVPVKTDYTSDGAVYLTPNKNPSKGIQWRDEANAGELIDVAPSVAADEDEKLSKTQRKKKNRQERRRLAAEGQRPVSDFESEADEAPARKASVHNTEPANVQARLNLRTRDSFGKPIATWQSPAPFATPTKSIKPPESFFEKRDRSRSRSPVKESKKTSSETETPSTPVLPRGGSRHQSQPMAIPRTPATVGKDTRNPFSTSPAASFLPASVQPPRRTALTTVRSGAPQPVHDTPTKSNRFAITPKTVRTGEDRDWALLLKLVSDFYEDRGHLIKPANLTNHSNDPKGIHVFVDASNIFIGFMDQLKRARNIPTNIHIPHVEPSFGSLALLMERRRPIAKRCLVGSKPHLAAFDTARGIGYECNILDKVLKARELTERQIYFKEQERKTLARNKKFGNKPTNPTNRNRSGSTSGDNSGDNGPVYAKEAMVEQGVDEILHLKMMESIVDTEEPSTMVLATGDAAQAEYSQGFMKMTQRALKAGWKVELVSWSKNISLAYKRPDFRREWGDKFKIVELDDYAEELLDM